MNPVLEFFISNQIGHLSLISFLYFLTWGYYLFAKSTGVSDDIEGVFKFSDRLVKDEKIDYYEIDTKEDRKDVKKRIKNFAFPYFIEFPGCLLRWFRVNWGRQFTKLGENSKGHSIYGYVQNARKHHALNLIVQWFNLILGYNFLSHLFGAKLAFLSILCFAVHPCGVQTVAWISGVNYLFSFFGALATFNISLYIHNPYCLILLIAITSGFSCLTLLPGCFNWIILFYLGHWAAGITALIIGIFVLFRQGREVVRYRINAFKEQKMEKSTQINWRKPIIMVKTFWYYCKLIPFPKRLGLFHTWGYHFEDPIQHMDKEFWAGVIALIGYTVLILTAHSPVQFGLIWILVYLIVFSNFITAQQFVSERYAFISTFGFSIVLAYYLQSYPVILAFLIGIAVMRVWVHMPTFKNEVRFYESNWFNFPESEVAMGNLGVAYLNHGMPNKAMDTWLEGSRQNKLYDVPWYNLYSICKQNGDLVGARRFLSMCLDSKTVHFPDQWKKEFEELNRFMQQQIGVADLSKRLNQSIKEANYERAGR